MARAKSPPLRGTQRIRISTKPGAAHRVRLRAIMARMSRSYYQTERGYEEPVAVQFSVFLANRVGQLQELLDLLEQQQVRVLGLSIVDSADWAVIRIVFCDPDGARAVFRKHAVAFTESGVLLVELEGENAMSEICGHLVRGEINIHFAYPLIIRRHGHPVMVLHVDESIQACRMLLHHGWTLLGHEDLGDPT